MYDVRVKGSETKSLVEGKVEPVAKLIHSDSLFELSKEDGKNFLFLDNVFSSTLIQVFGTGA